MSEPVQDNKSQVAVAVAEAPQINVAAENNKVNTDGLEKIAQATSPDQQVISDEIGKFVQHAGVNTVGGETEGKVELPSKNSTPKVGENAAWGRSILEYKDNMTDLAEAKVNPQNSNPLSNFLSFIKWRK